jgi:hypothetical protein
LRNGDRLTGDLGALDSHRIVITNALLGRLVLPIDQVARLDRPGEPATPPAPAAVPPATPSPPSPPPAPPAPAGAATPPPPKSWTLDVQAGTDLQFSQKDRQLFFGRLKWNYTQHRFRGLVDYAANYGEAEGDVTANDMEGSARAELDVSKKLFLFNTAGAGFNKVRKIDLAYEDSFGLGYKVVQQPPKFGLNADFGGNYQRRYFEDNTREDAVALRLGELLTWKISPRWSFDEKLEFYPRFTEWGDYRIRLEVNLRYLLLTNLTLNLTVIDLYDTQPAPGVTDNDLLLRSTLGIRF